MPIKKINDRIYEKYDNLMELDKQIKRYYDLDREVIKGKVYIHAIEFSYPLFWDEAELFLDNAIAEYE